jgi:hypothetical protein
MTWVPVFAWSVGVIAIVGLFIQSLMHEFRRRK